MGFNSTISLLDFYLANEVFFFFWNNFFFNDSILSLLCLVSYASLSWDFSGCLQFIFKISPTYCSLHSSDTMPHIAHKYFNCIIVSLWNLNYIWYLYDFIYVLIFMLHMHLIYILHYFYNIVYFSFYRSSFFFSACRTSFITPYKASMLVMKSFSFYFSFIDRGYFSLDKGFSA